MNLLTEQFVDVLHALAVQPISADLRRQAKRRLLDYLGVTLAGAVLSGEKGRALLVALGNAGESRVIGYGTQSNLTTAALLNGMSSHVAELDDGVRFCSVHAGGPLFSALLPVAESRGLSGEEVIRGVIVGYEAAIRLGRAIQPSHRDGGFHATGTCGTVGAAMGVAAALGYDRDTMQSTLAAALTSASGMLAMMGAGSELKPYNAAQAAMVGLTAALTAGAGFRGPDEVLDGPRGFLTMMARDVNEHYLTAPVGDALAIDLVYVKPYAACRHAHAAVEAALNLRHEYQLKPDQVERVSVHTYRLAVAGHDHTSVNGVTSAKMSTPFAIATALASGSAGLADFTVEKTEDRRILALAERVEVRVRSDLDAEAPEKRAAVVEIQTTDGRRLGSRVDLPKGEPESPLTDGDLENKFTGLARFSGKTEADCKTICDGVWQLETALPDIQALL